ncbi:hypothetical protein ACGFX8_37820 [Streptomyces sp. NPDC048362]|uniref:hypothetical protein n=1 Tax=Streptomyces sp. NPDC048362 TaxID=3365539 RepID=UPI00370F92D4
MADGTAWIGLPRDFSQRGRLLGSRQSVGLLLLMLEILGGVTAIAAALLPHAELFRLWWQASPRVHLNQLSIPMGRLV